MNIKVDAKLNNLVHLVEGGRVRQFTGRGDIRGRVGKVLANLTIRNGADFDPDILGKMAGRQGDLIVGVAWRRLRTRESGGIDLTKQGGRGFSDVVTLSVARIGRGSDWIAATGNGDYGGEIRIPRDGVAVVSHGSHARGAVIIIKG